MFRLLPRLHMFFCHRSGFLSAIGLRQPDKYSEALLHKTPTLTHEWYSSLGFAFFGDDLSELRLDK